LLRSLITCLFIIHVVFLSFFLSLFSCLFFLLFFVYVNMYFADSRPLCLWLLYYL
jgi:hypothetical protein